MSVVCEQSNILDKHFHFMFNKGDGIEDVIRLLNESSDLDITIDDNTIRVKRD